MISRILRSALVGTGFALCALLLIVAGLWLYLKFFWVPAHPGTGAVAGGLFPSLLAMPICFVAGFIWDWRRPKER